MLTSVNKLHGRPAMHAVVELLGLLLPLLRRLDAGLVAHLEAAGFGAGPPVFALAWVLTWFAHGVARLPAAARLFDAFLASHPLLPLYAAASAMKARRHPTLPYPTLLRAPCAPSARRTDSRCTPPRRP